MIFFALLDTVLIKFQFINKGSLKKCIFCYFEPGWGGGENRIVFKTPEFAHFFVTMEGKNQAFFQVFETKGGGKGSAVIFKVFIRTNFGRGWMIPTNTKKFRQIPGTKMEPIKAICLNSDDSHGFRGWVCVARITSEDESKTFLVPTPPWVLSFYPTENLVI